jgi:hypothetical protein
MNSVARPGCPRHANCDSHVSSERMLYVVVFEPDQVLPIFRVTST